MLESVSLLLKRKVKCYLMFVSMLRHVGMLELVVGLMRLLHIQSLYQHQE